MHQSHVIEVSGLFAGAAVSHGGRFRFLAVHPKVEKPDHNLWHLPPDMLRAVSGMIRTGAPRLPPCHSRRRRFTRCRQLSLQEHP